MEEASGWWGGDVLGAFVDVGWKIGGWEENLTARAHS